jgi:hypothetical protein
MKQIWPAPERNKQPILDVLRRVLPARGALVEIASGTGQHAAFLSAQLPAWTWQPSDMDPHNVASIDAWRVEAATTNLHAARVLDVCAADWNVGTVDAVFCANMIHITPWKCCVGLIAGAGRHLAAGGCLVIYGPFRVAGQHTSRSNEEFDASLKTHNSSWGVRDVEAVVELATGAGLTMIERVQMPANNQTLVFRRD